jgi:hypothetical protein
VEQERPVALGQGDAVPAFPVGDGLFGKRGAQLEAVGIGPEGLAVCVPAAEPVELVGNAAEAFGYGRVLRLHEGCRV